MLNEVLIKKMPLPYQLLYKLDGKSFDDRLRRAVEVKVRETRLKLRSTALDHLQDKAHRYGNSGLWSKRTIERLSRVVFNSKQPDDNNLGDWISIEIECIMQSQRAINDFVKYVRANKYTNYVTIKDDGSLRVNEDNDYCHCDDEGSDECNGEHSNEVTKEVILTFRYGEWKIVHDLCGELNRLKTYVNKTCGLHVHFDCRHITKAKASVMAKRVARTVPALRQLLPASRQNNTYCQQIITTPGSDNRYCFVNMLSYDKYQTLEIRGHSGTTDSVKIINWIKALKVIMQTKNRTNIEDFDALMATFKFDTDLQNYLHSRWKKFGLPPVRGDDVAQDNSTVTANYMVNFPRPTTQAIYTDTHGNIIGVDLPQESEENALTFDLSPSPVANLSGMQREINRINSLIQTDLLIALINVSGASPTEIPAESPFDAMDRATTPEEILAVLPALREHLPEYSNRNPNDCAFLIAVGMPLRSNILRDFYALAERVQESETRPMRPGILQDLYDQYIRARG